MDKNEIMAAIQKMQPKEQRVVRETLDDMLVTRSFFAIATRTIRRFNGFKPDEIERVNNIMKEIKLLTPGEMRSLVFKLDEENL